MELEFYFRERSDQKKTRTRTANINAELHHFIKQTAIHYNVPVSNLVDNILFAWKRQFEDQIKEQILNKLK